MTVSVRVLGEVQVRGAQGPQPAMWRRAREVVTLLALHPDGLSSAQVDEALWPGRRRESVAASRAEYLRLARRWLGDDPVTGRPYVAYGYGGRYALDGVVVDVEAWPDGDPGERTLPELLDALALVRGRPLSGIEDHRWEWAAPVTTAWAARVAGTARAAVGHAVAAGEWGLARHAAEVRVMVTPLDERAWRAAVRCAREDEGDAAAQRVRERARATLGSRIIPESA